MAEQPPDTDTALQTTAFQHRSLLLPPHLHYPTLQVIKAQASSFTGHQEVILGVPPLHVAQSAVQTRAADFWGLPPAENYTSSKVQKTTVLVLTYHIACAKSHPQQQQTVVSYVQGGRGPRSLRSRAQTQKMTDETRSGDFKRPTVTSISRNQNVTAGSAGIKKQYYSKTPLHELQHSTPSTHRS